MSTLVLFNKPYGVLPQFTDKGTAGSPRQTLSDYVDIPNVYPAGRLDRDSEGLMLLTDDGKMQSYLSNPKFGKEKTYWVQVEGIPDEDAMEQLRTGVMLKDGKTRPAKAEYIAQPPGLWERDPPIRERASIPDMWISLTLTEGKNRQVRRMTAAVGHPTLRLIRSQIDAWTIEGLQPGKFRTIQTAGSGKPRRKKPFRSPNTRSK
jgi:23S rRNA pseudouridine2457 synthase